ncbi:MAG: zinc ribbon domain-containing protein [Anaerolineae bacterium]|jgi:putative FmdB family regulatory protein|nr:zinc ribbon domain-containing protein [Anaerolineae bacterium]MBT7075667.1 zinc ribbon domain-containing protein [Anaerolineae bacterium]MBT7781734.1 zinc ribbon domain-containing protein [Anaerolineae bacterium]
MPVYTYRCDDCGIQFDEKEGFNDPTKTVCPECEKESLHRVYRPVGIVFKGSGFYATDNRSPSGKEARKHDKEERNAKKEKGDKKEKKVSEKKKQETSSKESKGEKKKK